jgi:NADH-quinone oxidoreductase subunit L
LRPLHTLFINKWYFDELIDLLVVRPGGWVGRFAQQTVERVFVDGALVGGTTGLVRAGSAAVRGAQTGFVRYYAGLLILGLTGVGLYFLLQAA